MLQMVEIVSTVTHYWAIGIPNLVHSLSQEVEVCEELHKEF